MSAERRTFEVQVKTWEYGHELHIAGLGVTQAENLADAEAVARDFIALDLDVSADSFDVVISGRAA